MSTAKYRKGVSPTPDMLTVLRRLQAGEKLSYGTGMRDTGRAWFAAEMAAIKRSTIRGLVQRGLVNQNYGFPTGTITLTKKGREFETL